jgi:ATP-dependent Zn protease
MGVVFFIILVIAFVIVGFFAFLLIMQERAVKAGNEKAKLFDFFKKKNKQKDTNTTNSTNTNQSDFEKEL